MHRHEFLTRLHDVTKPRGYLEVGVNDGRSLALSNVPSIAIDPAFKVTAEISCDVRLVKATSDDFFARPNPVAHLPGGVIDLAFIDGMHLFEFALRDFMNVEKHCAPGSVVVFDDMLPRDVDEAARDRHTKFWAGDVYKMIPVLRRYRPDLLCLPVNTQPTGLLVVLGMDPASTALSAAYDRIVSEWVVPDPQQVGQEILTRRRAVSPEALLAATAWPEIVRARNATRPRTRKLARLRRDLARAHGQPTASTHGRLRQAVRPRTRARALVRQLRGPAGTEPHNR